MGVPTLSPTETPIPVTVENPEITSPTKYAPPTVVVPMPIEFAVTPSNVESGV